MIFKIKQYRIGTFWGTIKMIAFHVAPYITWIQLGLVIVMSYYTTIGPMFDGWGVVFPFWVFLAILLLIIAGIMTFEYTVILPSYMGAFNHQQWYAKNPQRELLEHMESEIKAMRQEIAELKKGR